MGACLMAEEIVDIIVPCYNGERYLAKTLDCALGQTHRPARILVVDDGSTDSTRHIVESYQGRVGYVFKQNGGQASARNLGIARTQGRYVCLLDADDLPAPDMVERLVGKLEGQPEVDLAHADVLGFWGDDSLHPHAEFWRPRAMWNSYLEPLSVLCAVHGSATLMRRHVFERYGLFPEARSIQGCEDWYFWLQAVLQGAVIERVPEALCLYRYHASGSSSSGNAVARRESALMRSAVDLFRRHAIQAERNWSILAIGVMSVASRWLVLQDPVAFDEFRGLAVSIAPPSLRAGELAPAPAASGTSQAALLNLQLAEAMLELGHPSLAAVLFLRCRSWAALRSEVIRRGRQAMLERVSLAMSEVVSTELQAQRGSDGPSYATHVATALGVMSHSAGRLSEARDRFEEACLLDVNNTLPALELIVLDLKDGLFRSAMTRWRRLGERREPAIPADRLRRVARAVAVQAVQRHPRVREAARMIAARLSLPRLGLRRDSRRS
jgi:GT2 family glycosyltransferase